MLDFLLGSKQDFNAFINCEIKIIPSFLVIKPMSRIGNEIYYNCRSDFISLLCLVAGQSYIIGSNETHIAALNQWLHPVIKSRTSSWASCWIATKHGWKGSTFHNLCDNKGPTLVIVRVGDYIFGGYAGVSWRRHRK